MLATQNPIESEGTYPLPEAQVDRFLMKVLVDYPSLGEEAAVVGRSLARRGGRARARDASTTSSAYMRAIDPRLRRPCGDRLRRRARRRHAQPRASYGLGELDAYVEYGASPRGPIGLVRGRPAPSRCCAVASTSSSGDVRDLAADVLRHRLVLSYDALGDGVSADDILERILATVVVPEAPPVGTSQRRVLADARAA